MILDKPYIGITGFTKKEEVDNILKLIPRHSPIFLMVGLLVNEKTLYENKETNRYPKLEKIAKIFPNHPEAINLIHYDTKNVKNLCEQLTLLTEFGGSNLHGFQLNSGGRGIHFNVELMGKYIEAIRKNSDIRIVVAGGLSASTLGLVEHLIKKYPDLSIDAEHNLRNEDDTLNISFTENYIRQGLDIYNHVKKF